MRPISISSMQYQPGPVPTDPADIPRYLEIELNNIAAALQRVSEGHLDKTYMMPSKPRDGNLRYADGVSWNPGSGQGVYCYNGSVWKFLG